MKNTENGSLDDDNLSDDNLSDNSVEDDSLEDGNTDNEENKKQTLVLVDLKEGESLNSLDDLHLLRTIGAFYSNFGPNITVIPISELTQFAQKFTEPVLFNDVYIVGHGVFSSLGSKLSVEDCANYFKDSLSNQNFNVDHIHLTVCHSAERSTKEEDKDKESLLFTVHKKLHELDKKSVQITGYKNQIHLIRTDSLKCGYFKMNLNMPYASIIHEGLQELRKKNDCATHTDSVFNDLIYFTNKYLYGTDPEPPKKTGPIYELLNEYVTQLNSHGKSGDYYKILFDNLAILQNHTSKIDKFIKNNKIILDKNTILTDETKRLTLQQLVDLFNDLKNNKDNMNEDDFNIKFNQMYWAYDSIKKQVNSQVGSMKFFMSKQNELTEELKNYFISILDDKDSAISLSDKISICVKDIYLTKCPMDLMKKTNLIELSDKCTVVNARDNLNAQIYFLIDPFYTYTCNSKKDFPDFNMFGPTIAWEKGFWKEVLENLDNMEDSDKFDYKSINSCLNYICDAFTEFKKDNNEQEMKNILFELQKDISFFVNK